MSAVLGNRRAQRFYTMMGYTIKKDVMTHLPLLALRWCWPPPLVLDCNCVDAMQQGQPEGEPCICVDLK